MKSRLLLLSTIALMSSLSGCGLKSAFDMGDSAAKSPNQLCNRLKRNIVFYSMDQNHDSAWTSPAKRAELLREYRDNNCEDVLSGKANNNDSSTAFSLPGEKASQKDKIQIREE